MRPLPREPLPDPLDRLEADLVLRAAAIRDAEVDVQRAERHRAQAAVVCLADRIRAADDRPLRLLLPAGLQCEGTVVDVGADHVALAEQGGRRTWVRLDAVVAVVGLGRAHRPAGRVAAAWRLTGVLRRCAADRVPVLITTVDGQRLAGLPRSVGADHVDLVRSDVAAAAGVSSGRDGSGRPVVTVVVAAMAMVSAAGPGVGS